MGAALLVLALLAGWELYADLGGVDQFLLPAPSDVAASLWTDRGLLWANFTVTAGEVLLGIAVAVAAGVALAVAIHLSRTLRRATYPLLVAAAAMLPKVTTGRGVESRMSSHVRPVGLSLIA